MIKYTTSALYVTCIYTYQTSAGTVITNFYKLFHKTAKMAVSAAVYYVT